MDIVDYIIVTTQDIQALAITLIRLKFSILNPSHSCMGFVLIWKQTLEPVGFNVIYIDMTT